MLAKLSRELPIKDGLVYEPKWDGFRCIVFRDGDEVVLGSRNERPLTRYFPELLDPVRAQLPERCVVDGEIVIPGPNGLDFDALLQRIHPAESRVRMLAEETPASFVAFDLLALADDDLRPRPFDGPYLEDKRAMLKVKHDRTADCVVGGFRWHKDGEGVGSLLLGIYDDDGSLHHVGVCTSFSVKRRKELVDELAPLREGALEGHPWQAWAEAEAQAGGQRLPGGLSRWNRAKDMSWEPLRAERVVEVAYDHLQGDRFRHATTFVRWRPDKAPDACRYDQLEETAPFLIGQI